MDKITIITMDQILANTYHIGQMGVLSHSYQRISAAMPRDILNDPLFRRSFVRERSCVRVVHACYMGVCMVDVDACMCMCSAGNLSNLSCKPCLWGSPRCMLISGGRGDVKASSLIRVVAYMGYDLMISTTC